MKNLVFIIGLSFMLGVKVFAQEENSLIRKGNDKYVIKKYEDAQVDYLAALDKNTNSFKARFNLSDSYYQQKKYENALKELSYLANNEKDKMRLASVYHNIGNCYYKMGKLNEAEDAYKKALRNNPKDLDTKYNLALVKGKKNNGGKGGDSKDKNKDKDKDKKDKQDQKKQDQNKNKDDQKKQDQQQKQQPQPQQNKLSKEDADRMLDAMQQDEKKTLEKMKEQPKTKARSVKIEKAW